MDDQGKVQPHPERSRERNSPKQLLINIMLTYVVENTNVTNKRRDLLQVN